MATGGRVERGSRPRARTAEAAAPLPRRVSGERLDLSRLVPSGRSLGIAFLIALGALGAWLGARETGVFAVRTVDVGGANPAVASQVRKALASTRGTSLLKVDLDRVAADGGGDPDRRERPLRPCLSPHAPGRRRARARRRDRAPGRRLVPRRRERQGDGDGRPPRPPRARPDLGRTAASSSSSATPPRAICEPPSQPSRRSSARTSRAASSSVTATADALTLRLRSGLEIRLGDALDVPLKLAVAARVIPLLDADTAYLDVAVPERPVAGSLNSQVEVDAAPSTTP